MANIIKGKIELECGSVMEFELYPDVKVVVVANLYGTPAKLDEIAAVCKQHGNFLITHFVFPLLFPEIVDGKS